MKFGLFVLVVVSVVVFFGTSFVTFKVNERRFKRRNVAGVEEFATYGTAVATQAAESSVMALMKPLKWASVVLGAVALLMLFR